MRARDRQQVLAFASPAWLVVGLLVLFPVFYTVRISFTNWNVYHWTNSSFIGLANYLQALKTLTTDGFLYALLLTVLWTVANLVIQLVIALALALILNVKGLRGKGVYKTILILPWAMPPYISALIWRNGVFHGDFGLVNQILRKLGADGPDWLGNGVLAFVACLVVNLWMALPFMVLVIDGGLQSIDASLYEIAAIEGAGFVSKTMRITLPLLRPILFPVLMLTGFLTFKQFDIFYLMTMQRGSATGAGIHTVLTYVYQNVVITNNYGYAAAASSVVFLLILVFSLGTRRPLAGPGEHNR